MPNVVAIVTCGGASRRMGRPKADLPFGPETLLERAVRQLLDAVGSVVVAAAPAQSLPDFDARRVRIVRDPSHHPGPLGALGAALAAVPEPADFAYLAAVDAPCFSADWLRLLIDRIGDRDAAAAEIDGRWQPFAALYRIGPTREAVARLRAEGVERLTSLLDRLATRRIEGRELAAIDPAGLLFRDLDRPEDYLRALRELAAEGPAGPRDGGAG
ncbi:MAG: hypothetical protein BGO49_09605 [Planctomycetales bacterium 71-10]|nr:MAG: hypothetical protein BGO49_09605 [Planctomycetales bacterium 71-10]